MANNLIQLKRTSVSGRVPNTVTLPNPGELALNMTDGILYSTNGAQVFEIGANNTNVNVSNTLTVKTVSANGSNGTSGQVLTSNGTVSYWADVSGAVSVNVNAQYIWTNTQTFTNLITFSDSITIGNSSVNTEIDAGYISVGNSSVNTQIEPGIVRLSGSEIFIGNDVVVNSSSIFVGNVDIAFDSINVGNVSVSTNNIQIEGRYVLTSETAGVANDALYLGGIAAANYQTIAGLSSNVATLTANNTNFVGSVSAANVVSNAQLSANLGNYQTTAGLAGNVATLAANSATYLNGNTASDLQTYADNKASNAYTNAVSYVDGKSYVNNSQLSSNLANYQTIAGLAGNVAQLTSNNASYAFGKTEDALNVNSAYNSNNSNFLGGVAAADYQTEAGLAANVAQLSSNNASYAFGKTESSLNVNSAINANNASYLNGNTASDLLTYIDNKSGNAYTNAVSYVDGKSYVNTSQLSGNLSNYAQLSGAAFTGNVSANNANTLYDLTVGRNLTVAGNLNVTGNVTVIGANNLSIVDNFIYLNSNNEVDNIDIGFAGNYNDGVYRHAGFFRDASDGYWKVFDGYQPEPDANVNIDTGNNTFRIANFWANNARVGNTTVYSTVNSTAFSGSANDTTYFGGNDISNFVRTSGAYTLSGNITFNSNVSLGAGLRANGSYGNAGQVLVSNGSGGIYWSEDQLYGNVVANAITVNILTVNFISLNTGTITVGNSTVNTDIGNNYISVGNSTSFVNVYSNRILIGSASINSTVYTGTASPNLNATFSWTNNHTFGDIVTFNDYIYINSRLRANGSFGGAGDVLFSNGTGVYWEAPSVNVNATYAWNNNQTFADTVTFNGNTTLNANITIGVGARLRANGSFGTAGQVLASNGTGVYWTNDQGANSITANSLTANFVSITSGTLTVGNSTVNTDIGNNYISVGNTSGFVNVYSDRIYIGNSVSNATINSTVYTGTANNATFFGGNAISNFVRTSGAHTLSGNITFSSNVSFTGVNGKVTFSFPIGSMMYPDISGTYDLGASGSNWRNLYIQGGIYAGAVSGAPLSGSFGTNGQVLTSNGSAAFWSSTQSSNSITANTLTANYISISLGTLTVGNSTVNTDIGNNYISVGNSTSFVNVYSNRILIGNASINSTVYTGTANNALTANNSTNFGGNDITNFVRTSGAHTLSGNITFNGNIQLGTSALLIANGSIGGAGQVLTSTGTNGSSPYWSTLPGVNTSAQYIWSNTQTFNGNIALGTSNRITANGGLGIAGQVLTTNGNDGSPYWSTLPAAIVNVNAQYIWTNTHTFTNTITFNQTINGTANNASFLGETAAASYVQNTDTRTLSGNLIFSGANVAFTGNIRLTGGVLANNSLGTAGQILASNGTSVYWTNAAASSASSATSETFAGNGSNTVFTLSSSVADQNNIIITVDGLVQVPNTNYSISNTTLTFTEAPPASATIEARTLYGGGGSNGSSGSVAMEEVFVSSFLLGGM